MREVDIDVYRGPPNLFHEDIRAVKAGERRACHIARRTIKIRNPTNAEPDKEGRQHIPKRVVRLGAAVPITEGAVGVCIIPDPERKPQAPAQATAEGLIGKAEQPLLG